jgi:hypothetical protein
MKMTARSQLSLACLALLAFSAAGCISPALTPVNLTPGLRAFGTPSTEMIRLFGGTDDEIVRYVESETNTARTHLASPDAIETLKAYSKTLDRAKWANVGLSAGTTVLAQIATGKEPKNKNLNIATLVVGALSTVVTAVRDDKSIAGRVATCESVVRSGNKTIDTYHAKWRAEALGAPPANTPERKVFLKDLAAATSAVHEVIDDLMTTCR